MDDKQIIEGIIHNIAGSFSGTQSTKDQNGEWKVLHEHTSSAADWDGTIDE